LNATKAQHNMLSALGSIKDRLGKDWRLYLIGKFIDEDYKLVIEKAIQSNGLGDHVVVTGFVENAKRLMPGFDVIVLTTLGETFGLVLVEAMMSGVAVIGTNSEGVPEIIDHLDTGILVEPNDPDGLGEAVLTLYQNENLRNQLAASGKRKAVEMFDYDRHFNRLMAIYMEVI
jgi:glycosyltransferase involved in cell wall biosynthesis